MASTDGWAKQNIDGVRHYIARVSRSSDGTVITTMCGTVADVYTNDLIGSADSHCLDCVAAVRRKS